MRIDSAYVSEVAFVDDEKVYIGTVRLSFTDNAFGEIRNISPHYVKVGVTIGGEPDLSFKEVETALIRQAYVLLSASSQFLNDANYESLIASRVAWRDEAERQREERNKALFTGD